MKANLRKLVEIGSHHLGPDGARFPEDIVHMAGALHKELEELLALKNGFFVFESALHIFPLGPASEGYDLGPWNSNDLWRAEYGDMAVGSLFFAEDIFGEQFCLREGRVWRFDPETGEYERVATNLEGWARRILQNYEQETGYPLAHAWQETHGRLPPRERLLPKMPFVLGGEYNVENLYAQDAVKGMKSRAYLARQIRDLPDGAQIQFEITDACFLVRTEKGRFYYNVMWPLLYPRSDSRRGGRFSSITWGRSGLHLYNTCSEASGSSTCGENLRAGGEEKSG